VERLRQPCGVFGRTLRRGLASQSFSSALPSLFFAYFFSPPFNRLPTDPPDEKSGVGRWTLVHRPTVQIPFRVQIQKMDSGRRPLQARAEDLELYERLKSSKDYADGGPLKKWAFTPQHAMRNVLKITVGMELPEHLPVSMIS
jgi:hypothetical protein